MAIELYQFLNEQSIAILVNQILTKVNIRTNERILQEIDESSSDKQYLSALALYNLLQTLNIVDADFADHADSNAATLAANAESIANLQASQAEQDGKLTNIETSITNTSNLAGTFQHLTIETITGDITAVTDPNDTVLYFQRSSDTDIIWTLYIYKVVDDTPTWIPIGDVEVDLSTIWSKDENEELKEALGIHYTEPTPETDVIEVVEDAFNNNKVDYRMDPEGEPIIDDIEYGTNLSDVVIEGSMMYDGVEVPGTFSFITTDEEFTEMVENAESEEFE